MSVPPESVAAAVASSPPEARERVVPAVCVTVVAPLMVSELRVPATLVVPALATFYSRRLRYTRAYIVGVLGYSLGLGASVLTDLPSGAMIVCTMVAAGIVVAALGGRSDAAAGAAEEGIHGARARHLGKAGSAGVAPAIAVVRLFARRLDAGVGCR